MRNSNIYAGVDFTGTKHGRLTVIRKADAGRTQWVCKCECGKEKILTPYYFLHDLSCGCLEKENKAHLGDHNRTHGMTDTRLYAKYCKMKERCHNPNYKFYHCYGGRGIKICSEWLGVNGFSNFSKWAYENGYDDKIKGYAQSLDRINVDGDYEPSNCKWANQKEQCRNRRNTLYIEYRGKNISCAEFCEIHKLDYTWTRRRIHKKQTADKILSDWEKKKA